MKNIYIIIGIFILAVAAVALSGKSSSLGGSLNSTFYTATNSIFAVTTTTPTLAVAANPGRQYLSIYNNGAVTVFLELGAADTAGKGIGLPAGSRYEINQTNLYGGSVYVTLVSGTSTLAISEK